MKAILYARRSSEGDEKQLKSIPAQIEEMTEIARRQGVELVQVFEESQSAKESGKRPNFEAMLELVRTKAAQAIVVWNADRLSRNPVDAARVIELMDKGLLLQVITPQTTYHATPMEKAMLMIMMVNAKLENDNKSVNVKRGTREKARRGEYPFSNPPTGYKRINKELVVQDEKAPIIRKAFEQFAAGGMSVADLARWLKKEGYVTRSQPRLFHKSAVYKMLTTKSYTGYIDVEDEEYHLTKLEPIVSRDLFNQVQDVLHGRTRPRPRIHTFAFTGLMACPECGCSITATKKLKGGRYYTYYHCTKKRGNCKQPPLSETRLDDQILPWIKKITLTPELVELLLSLLKKHHAKEVADRSAIMLSVQREFNEIQGRIDRLLELRINDEIDENEYRSMKKQYIQRKSELELQLQNIDLRANTWLELAENCFANLNRLEELYINGTAEEKKRIVRVVGSNLQLKDKQLVWAYKKPLDKVAFRTQNASWQPQGESNPSSHIESVVS